mgnify:CR=1 FL=1
MGQPLDGVIRLVGHESGAPMLSPLQAALDDARKTFTGDDLRSPRREVLVLRSGDLLTVLEVDGQTVGVGMPVIIRFDVPIQDKAAIERHLKVVSQPAQVGAFHWISDQEVHWRPATYWKPGTDVTVTADVNSIPAGNGIYGQEDRTSSFTIGDALTMKIDLSQCS